MPGFYGFWIPQKNETFTYTFTSPKNLSHLEDFNEFADIKGIPYIEMHGFGLSHLSNGDYKLLKEKITHGHLESLSQNIYNVIFPSLKIIGTKATKNQSEAVATSTKCDLSVKITATDFDSSYELKDINGNTVAKKRVKNQLLWSIKDQCSELMANYLAHEQHRASLAIHGATDGLRYAPDHIPENINPIYYWPNHALMAFGSSPPLVKLSRKD